MNKKEDLAFVVIGRNEGERLKRCLSSILATGITQIVYVDSGSSDNSVPAADALGVKVVSLETDRPFTAARARNTGFYLLHEHFPKARFVQFIDGDCELAEGWIETALAALLPHSDVAIVCGRVREMYPEASIYNRLCDIEWDTPVGETTACGGIAMMRVNAFDAVGGFNPSLIAGEEPELCLRLRRTGWKILRLDAEMTRHDAAMYRLRQWWRRCERSGYAYAEGAWLHGRSAERYRIRECVSIWVWTVAIPLLGLGLIVYFPWGMLIALLYPYLFFRISRTKGRLFATYCIAGKFPQLLGQLKFLHRMLHRKRGELIEYK